MRKIILFAIGIILIGCAIYTGMCLQQAYKNYSCKKTQQFISAELNSSFKVFKGYPGKEVYDVNFHFTNDSFVWDKVEYNIVGKSPKFINETTYYVPVSRVDTIAAMRVDDTETLLLLFSASEAITSMAHKRDKADTTSEEAVKVGRHEVLYVNGNFHADLVLKINEAFKKLREYNRKT